MGIAEEIKVLEDEIVFIQNQTNFEIGKRIGKIEVLKEKNDKEPEQVEKRPDDATEDQAKQDQTTEESAADLAGESSV